MPWVEKYRPKRLSEFVDQREAVAKFLSWVRKWKPGDKALLFYGPPGTGKTSLVYAFAEENDWEVIETNASDIRSPRALESLIAASTQRPLLKKSRIFLFDEVEGIASRAEVGGIRAILKLLETTRFPVVLVANDPWDKKLVELRNSCEMVEFRKIPVWDIEKRLAEICRKEGVEVDRNALRMLAKRSEGDLRSAINDLEAVARGRKKVTVADLEALGYREREATIFDALKMIFKTKSAIAAKLAIRNVDRDPEEIFLWIENNIANEYEDPEEIAKAYEALSKADLFRQWVKLRQDWKFMKYMVDLMTAGVSQAKKDTYKKFTKYKYPSTLAMLGATRAERREESEKLEKLSKKLHCSTRKIRTEFLPYLEFIEARGSGSS